MTSHYRRRLCAASLALCLSAVQPVLAAEEAVADPDSLYYLGMLFGRQLSDQMNQLALTSGEREQVLKGAQDQVRGKARALDEAKVRADLQQLASARQTAAAERERDLATAYIKDMAAEAGAVTTPSGIVMRELKAGSGESPAASSTIRAHYHGTLRDGTVFDSSVDRGEPIQISLERVIPCWTEAIQKMRVGGKSKLTCPAALAYGEQGSGAIPGGAAITFEVELLEIVQ